MKIELAKTEIIHFVGIGGIGMSGLALIMEGLGFKVQGSDITTNKNIERLKQNKIKVYIGHHKKNIQNSTILVISSAIKQSNSEILIAKKKQLPIYKRGDMLAHVVSLLKRNIETTFNAITVDSDTSTNDMAGIFATKKAKNAKIYNALDPKLKDFENALFRLTLNLAKQIVVDGEGAKKFIKSLKLKTHEEWLEYIKGKRKDLPTGPVTLIESPGWTSHIKFDVEPITNSPVSASSPSSRLTQRETVFPRQSSPQHAEAIEYKRT